MPTTRKAIAPFQSKQRSPSLCQIALVAYTKCNHPVLVKIAIAHPPITIKLCNLWFSAVQQHPARSKLTLPITHRR
ncbi:MAG: hypothetical protein F6K30_12005 [Cyanothece sp. SIO2G6]|nr:hypothetical protein [Cyanothece sp. SIO2G6]